MKWYIPHFICFPPSPHSCSVAFLQLHTTHTVMRPHSIQWFCICAAFWSQCDSGVQHSNTHTPAGRHRKHVKVKIIVIIQNMTSYHFVKTALTSCPKYDKSLWGSPSTCQNPPLSLRYLCYTHTRTQNTPHTHTLKSAGMKGALVSTKHCSLQSLPGLCNLGFFLSRAPSPSSEHGQCGISAVDCSTVYVLLR